MVDADGDRHGNAVNMAFRVEGIREENRKEPLVGEPPLRTEDRIYLTAPLHAEIPPATQAACRPVGQFALKGISDHHLLYQVLWEELDCALLGP
jgi:class 3 adenylate cyclase